MNRKAFSLFALSVMIFTLPLAAFAYHTGSESELAANPELVPFRNHPASASDRLAINPELAALASYSGSSPDKLAINPELAVSRGFGVPDSRGLEADSARWAAIGAYYGSSFVAANPELISVRSYGQLSDNPELLTLQKFDICGC